MKPKRDILLIMMAIGLTATSLAAANDIYNNGMGILPSSNQQNYSNEAHGVCANFSFYYKDSKRVFTRHYFSIKNETGVPQTVHITYTSCFSHDGVCKKQEKDLTLNNDMPYVSRAVDLYYDVNYRDRGDYYFTSITDVNGFINMHDQRTCKIDILK